MARCDYCNSYILFGGERKSGRTFCNDDCLQEGRLMLAADRLPQHIVDAAVDETHQGECPLCHGPGPVDVHTSHSVWSIIALTSWRSTPNVCCRSCGRQKQLTGLLTSGLLGWWGFPWGLIYTPIQISRNLSGIFGGPDPDVPTEQLETMTRLDLAIRREAGEALPDHRPASAAERSSPSSDDRIPVECEDCGKRFKARASMAGKSGRCPGCGSTIAVPEVDVWLDDEFEGTGDEWDSESYEAVDDDAYHVDDYAEDNWEESATRRPLGTSRRKREQKQRAITPLRVAVVVGLLLFGLPIFGAIVVGVIGVFADRKPQPQLGQNQPVVIPEGTRPQTGSNQLQSGNIRPAATPEDALLSAPVLPGNGRQLADNVHAEPEVIPVPPLDNADPDGQLWIVLSNFREASRQGFGSINRRWLIDYQIAEGTPTSRQKYVLHVSKSLGGGSFKQYSDTPVQLEKSGTIEFAVSPALGVRKDFVATIAVSKGNRDWQHLSAELAPGGPATTSERPPTVRELAGSEVDGKEVAIARPAYEKGTGPFPTLTVQFELLQQIDQTRYYMLVAESPDGEKMELDIRINLQRATVGTESQYGARLVGPAAQLKPPFKLYIEKRKSRFISPVRPETPEVVSNQVSVTD